MYRDAGILQLEKDLARDFYLETAKSIGIGRKDSALVICGGPYDRNVMRECGLIDAVVSNVDHHGGETDLSPFTWEYQDAEAITRADESADWVIVHAGLHHCGSPHKALCEMLRVAKKGVLVIEARDSLLMRLSQRLGLTPRFELEPALLTGGSWGGYRNTKLPNYIYRWTEREFEKTVTSFAPQHVYDFSYRYGYRLPLQRLAMSKSPFKRVAVKLVSLVSALFETIMPRQGNCFAMIARKTGELQPWLCLKDGEIEVSLDYVRAAYEPEKYRRGPK
jgi:SAM-dependent methyltransferase